MNDPEIQRILKIVASYYGVNSQRLVRTDRHEPLATTRKVAIKFLVSYLKQQGDPHSVATVAKLFGRTGAAIRYSLRSLRNQRDVDSSLKRTLNELKAKIVGQDEEFSEDLVSYAIFQVCRRKTGRFPTDISLVRKEFKREALEELRLWSALSEVK